MEEKDFIKSLIDDTEKAFLKAALMQDYQKAKKDLLVRFRLTVSEDQFNQLRKAAGIAKDE